MSISFANLNIDTLLLLGGVIVLLINVIYGVIRARQNRLKAGWQTVLVMVVACVAVAIGIIGYTTQNRAAAAAATNRFNFGRNGQTTGQGTGAQGTGTQGTGTQQNSSFGGQNGTGQNENVDQSVNGAPDQQATPATGGGNGGQGGRFGVGSMPPAQQTMIANGQGADAFATLVAEGTQMPPRVLTAVASGQFPVGGGQGANAANGNTGGGSGAPAGGNNASGSNAPSGTNNGGGQTGVFASMPPEQQTMVANGQTGDAFATLVAEGTLQFSAPSGQGANAANGNNGGAPAGGNNASGVQAPAGFSAPSGFQSPATANTNAAQTNPTGVPAGGDTSGVQAPSGFSAPPGFQSPSNATTGGQTDQSGTGAQASGGNGQTGGTGTGTGAGTGTGGNGTFQRGTGTGAQPISVPANLIGGTLAAAGGVLVFFSGLYLYYYERRRPGFVASASRGLLNAGAGVFIVSAAIIVPTLPASISGTSNTARPQIVVSTAIVTRSGVPTATPSPAPQATLTPTDLPTLTPTPTEGTLVMATPIQYAYAEPTAASDCKVTSTSQLNLRGDPSTSNMAIGRIPPGSILVVTGQSADNKWLQVTFNDGVNSLDGWVSTQFTSTLTGCTGTPPVIATGTSIPAPTATATKSP